METIKQEARLWVSQMNEYPLEMIQILMETIPNEWQEVTLPKLYDKVYVFNLPEGCEDYEPSGEIVKVADNKYVAKLNDDNTITLESDDFAVERDTILPMWGCMWSFKNKADEYWMKDKDGIKAMSECGFRIYEHEEGLFLRH
ncbi:MAG: hypothetical protein LUG91_08805 [Ruminococcus sp.]|nr:hypothetical protein [Ruminococcus sp.]